MKCIASSGNIRAVAVNATELVFSMSQMHGLSGQPSVGLGEAVMSALLLASYCKQGERINLNIQGSGHYVQALVDADPDGFVRGYIVPRSVPAIAKEQGPWGTGLLSVLRTKRQDQKRPYIGTVPLVTGHLAKDLSFYWFQSEQIPSAVGLSVHLEKNRVQVAGGFLVQVMPGADEDEVKMIQRHIQNFSTLDQTLMKSADPVSLLSGLLNSTPFTLVEEKPLRFSCECSRERVMRALALIGVDELASMLQEDGKAGVKCDFCSKDYLITDQELKELISSARKPTLTKARRPRAKGKS